jgi:23S rRNA pseudouridine1911/1915/1917 synthase
MKRYIVKKEDKGKRVDKILTFPLREEPRLESIPRSFVSQSLNSYILVNGSKKKPSYRVKIGDEIVVELDALRDRYEQEQIRQDMESKIIVQKGFLDIVFEDKDFLVLRKEPGIVVHPGIGNEKDTLANYVKGYLTEQGEYDPQLKRGGIVHRLDKGVGGLILFAKNRKAQKHFCVQFEKHEVLKIYYAECVPEDSIVFSTIKNPQLVDEVVKAYKEGGEIELSKWQKIEGTIRRDPVNRKRMVFDRNCFNEKYRYAKSFILPIAKGRMFVLIETGRMHQIRASLKSLGLVLKGDSLYGYRGEEVRDNIDLNSVVLGFEDLEGKRKVFNIINEFL